MRTVSGDSNLGWNPYYGAPICSYCGSIKSGKYDKCECEAQNENKPIDYNSKKYREFQEWLENGGKIENQLK